MAPNTEEEHRPQICYLREISAKNVGDPLEKSERSSSMQHQQVVHGKKAKHIDVTPAGLEYFRDGINAGSHHEIS